MSTVVVQCLPDDDSMTISFTHDGKRRNMKRSKEETLEKSLKRISLSIQNVKKKSKKDKKADMKVDEQVPTVLLCFNNEVVNEVLTNEQAWKDGSVLMLGDKQLTVEVNPPSVISLSLPGHIMADFPIFPVVELQFATINNCLFTWYRSVNPDDNSASASPLQQSECNWEEVGCSFFYKPTLSDLGCHLKLVCTAGRNDRMSSIKTEVISDIKVSAGPGSCPFEDRHLYTSKKLGSGHLRVVSYNILADLYCRDEFAVNVLYHYCPPYALDIGYRKQLLLKELTGYNSDILCLQECGGKLFDNFLERAMEMLGYQGLMKCKAGEIPEGEAIFFNREKFEFVSSHDVAMKESLLQDPINEDILHHVSSIPALLENLTKKNSIVQITVLKDKEQNKHLCIVNTHLYYKPNSPHIRLIQAAIILNQVKKVVQLLTTEPDENQQSLSDTTSLEKSPKCDNVVVILCGDLNSNPKSGVIELLCAGLVDSSHHDWTRIEDQDEHCQSMSISHQFNFTSACGFPPYTNFTKGFKGTLDYIFNDSNHLEVEAVIPVPPEDEMSLHSGLPSVVMPSDHVAIICDLKWR